jgi:glyoxylase-like metal-dependent hydrolase (beta-lactamase superfamily II)
MGAFWTCRSAGFALRVPLAIAAWVASIAANLRDYCSTFRRRVTLLDGRLTLLFLGSVTADLVPLVFGERFVAIIYDGIAIDPGSSKMRGSLRRHFKGADLPALAVTATHHHEEHSGNLEWFAKRKSAQLFLRPKTLQRLAALRLPAMRRFVIGQPPPVTGPVNALGERISGLEVIPTPGHCDDHVSFFDPREKLLIAGDAFMGSYFSSPNPDVDSIAWISTLERLLATGVEILVEGHGHIHTLRADIPDVPGVVIRHSPQEALRAKLDFFRWVRQQIERGQREGLPPRAIAATCFPWGRRWSWERLGADLSAQLLSGGEFSRTELVRSFHRGPDTGALPEVFEVRL